MKEIILSLLTWIKNLYAIEPEETAKMEQMLVEQFAPVSPRPAYVNDLGRRLSDQTQPILVQRPSLERDARFWQWMLLITAGVASGFLLILVGVRFFSSIAAVRRTRQGI